MTKLATTKTCLRPSKSLFKLQGVAPGLRVLLHREVVRGQAEVPQGRVPELLQLAHELLLLLLEPGAPMSKFEKTCSTKIYGIEKMRKSLRREAAEKEIINIGWRKSMEI